MMLRPRDFIFDLKELCKDNGFELYLPKSKSIRIDGRFVAGYLDSDNKVLACAKLHKDFTTILIHESCHLDQFIEKDPVWKDDTIDIDKWLDGKEYDMKHVVRMLDNSKWLELDCEKRSVNKMLKYNIPYNGEYIQKANAYVQFYNYLKVSRKWCSKKNTPYSNKKLWSTMPDKFMPKAWYNKLSDEHLAAFIQNGI